MADVKQWITIKGRHIPIFEGETKEDAIKRIKENTKKGPAIKKATVKKKPVPKKEEKPVDKNSTEYRTQRVKDALKYAKGKIDKESYSWTETVLDAKYEYDIPDKDVPVLERAMKVYAMKNGKFEGYYDTWKKKFKEEGVNVDTLLYKNKPLEKVHEAADLLKDYKGYEVPDDIKEKQEYLRKNREKHNEMFKERIKISDELDKARDKYVDKDMLDILSRQEARFLVNDKDHPEIMELKQKYDRLREDDKAFEDMQSEVTDFFEDKDAKQSRIEKREYGRPDFEKAAGEYRGFKTNDTGTSYYNDLLEKGKAEIVEMAPEEYIKECAYYIFTDSTLEKTLRGRVDGDLQDTEKYAQMMREGIKFNTPYLNYKDEGQEGLHRAVAAYMNGIEKIPVVVVGRRRF